MSRDGALSAHVRPFVMLQGARSGASRNRAERGVRPTWTRCRSSRWSAPMVQDVAFSRTLNVEVGARVSLGKFVRWFLGENFALMFRISASSQTCEKTGFCRF